MVPAAAARLPVAVLTGPTGTGKSDLALRLARRLPLEIISVDSALVYRGMDIGTAKPSGTARAQVPHHLVDIRDPADSYSAGDFVRDARAAITAIHAREHIPLLVGGTMLYLRALLDGMAALPAASPAVRAALDARAAHNGWPALHAELAGIDPAAAARIHPLDAQRIQRALEVHELTGRPISHWQRETHGARAEFHWQRYALIPASRETHRQRLAARFGSMLDAGLPAEVQALYERGDLSESNASIRAVGYRQLWQYCAGRMSLEVASQRAVIATAQLAKRQLTWLRADQEWMRLDPEDHDVEERLAVGLFRMLAGHDR